jgi:phosphatidate cytidylyltransferase
MVDWAWNEDVAPRSHGFPRGQVHAGMKTRILTGFVLVPLTVYLIGWAPRWLFFLALLVAIEWGLGEYFALCRRAGLKSLPVAGYVAGGLFCLVQALGGPRTNAWLLVVMVAALLAVLALALFRSTDLHDFHAAAASTSFGIIYLGLNLSWLMPLRFSDPVVGRKLLFLLFLVVACCDTLAYFGGRALGRTPLFPRVSPRKTVEGSVIGSVGGLLAAGIYIHWGWRTAPLGKMLVLAACLVVAEQVGDLVESALKRGANVKDSGNLLPGHGGLLDRIDGLLFAVPVAWWAICVTELWRT